VPLSFSVANRTLYNRLPCVFMSRWLPAYVKETDAEGTIDLLRLLINGVDFEVVSHPNRLENMWRILAWAIKFDQRRIFTTAYDFQVSRWVMNQLSNGFRDSANARFLSDIYQASRSLSFMEWVCGLVNCNSDLFFENRGYGLI
jgi:hypothetical protein